MLDKYMIVHYKPEKTTLVINDFVHSYYETLYLSTDHYWCTNEEWWNASVNEFYKIYLIIEKNRFPFDIEDEYPIFFDGAKYIIDNENHFQFPMNTYITFSDFKSNDWVLLRFIIARTLQENNDNIVKNEIIHIHFDASFGFHAKSLDNRKSLNHLYINGIYLVKRIKYLNVGLHYNCYNDDKYYYPEKYYKKFY